MKGEIVFFFKILFLGIFIPGLIIFVIKIFSKKIELLYGPLYGFISFFLLLIFVVVFCYWVKKYIKRD